MDDWDGEATGSTLTRPLSPLSKRQPGHGHPSHGDDYALIEQTEEMSERSSAPTRFPAGARLDGLKPEIYAVSRSIGETHHDAEAAH